MDRNRYGSDNGDFAYRISYTNAEALGNAVNNSYTGGNPMGYDGGAMKVMSQGVNSSASADNVVQVSTWFERTTIGVGQSIVLDADHERCLEAQSANV